MADKKKKVVKKVQSSGKVAKAVESSAKVPKTAKKDKKTASDDDKIENKKRS